jgi:hypothetical protein
MSGLSYGQNYNPYSQDDNVKKAKAEFVQRVGYCPDGSQVTNTGCRGYVPVPIKPLECGGATASYNMRWEKADKPPSKDCK